MILHHHFHPEIGLHRVNRRSTRAGLRAAAAVAAAAFAIAAPAGCARIDPDGPRFQVIEEDGVPVAETINGPLHADPIFRIEELLVLTEDPARPESILFNPSAFTLGPDGNCYVADDGNRRVAVFDAAGTYQRSFGREGSGPGEFRMMELQRLTGDTLSIFDYTQQRTTHMRTDGTLLATLSPPGGRLTTGFDRTPDGTWVLMGVSSDRSGVGPIISRRKAVVLESAGRDTLGMIEVGTLPNMLILRYQTLEGGGSAVSGRSLPFAGSHDITWIPGRGILASDGNTRRLAWYDLTGRPVLTIHPGLPIRPVTPELRQTLLDRVRADRREREEELGRSLGPLPEYSFAENIGAWIRTTVDDAGWIWLLDALDNELHENGQPWLHHVIDAEGRYLGTALLPATRFTIAGSRLHAFIEDPETGARVPTVFRIVPNADGLIYP